MLGQEQNKEYFYFLPTRDGKKECFQTDVNSLIIIGANGSGKSKLGAKIEQFDWEQIHRIAGQRDLNFNENIPLKNYSQAEDIVFWGSDDVNARKNKPYRWNWGRSYTTALINDFDAVLAAIIALKNNENDNYVEICKRAQKENSLIPPPEDNVVDKLIWVWEQVLPHRRLKLVDSKFISSSVGETGQFDDYCSNQMSDGERSVLYLIAQVLSLRENKTIIIDEPELHLHRSIMHKLWKVLENFRKDCFFIYITHDTDFAASHVLSDKIWVRGFDGKTWDYERIKDINLSEPLLFEILGNRKNIIFVEGEQNSLDKALYEALYPEYYIVACGSCDQVISRTKAYRNSRRMHRFRVFGIVDRDYRTEHEISSLKEQGVYSLKVAEVENLFIVEDLIKCVANYMGNDPDKTFAEVESYVIDKRFNTSLEQQIQKSVVANFKRELETLDLKGVTPSGSSLAERVRDDFGRVCALEQEKFQNALKKRNYDEILKLFNDKGVAKCIGQFLNLKNNAYMQQVIHFLNTEAKDEILRAVRPYCPSLPKDED